MIADVLTAYGSEIAPHKPSARNIGVGAAGHKRDRAELATFIVKRLARQTIGHDGA